MPKHTQTYLDGYQVKIAAMVPGEDLADTSTDVELIFHNEDHSDTITVPIPADIRPKLAAYLVGMQVEDPVDAMAAAKSGERSDVELLADAEDQQVAAEAAASGRCSRCGARDAGERGQVCPNVALIQLGDVGAMEGFAENGCQAAQIMLQAGADEVDPPEHADIDDEADHGPVEA